MFLDCYGPKSKVETLGFYAFYTFVPLIVWALGMAVGILPNTLAQFMNFLGVIGATVLTAIVITARKLDKKNYLLCVLTFFLPFVFPTNLASMIVPTALVARKTSTK